MEDVDFERLMLMRHAARVERAHVLPWVRTQSVGEHTFGVIALMHFVYPDADAKLYRAALYHDVPEVLTGDIPSPAKWRWPQIEEGLRTAENGIKLEYGLPHTVELVKAEKEVLKFCDIMELALYCIEQADRGDMMAAGMARRALNGIKIRQLCDVTPNALRLYDLAQTYWEANFAGRSVFNEWKC